VAEKDQKLAQRCANALAAEFLKRKQQFHIRLPRAADGLAQAMKTEGEGPAIVLDPADNPLSGGIGDTTGLFQALLDSKPPAGTVFAFLGPVLGGHVPPVGSAFPSRPSSADGSRPISAPPCRSRPRSEADRRRFRNEGPYEHNLAVDVGRTVLLEAGNVRVIVAKAARRRTTRLFPPARHRPDHPLLCVRPRTISRRLCGHGAAWWTWIAPAPPPPVVPLQVQPRPQNIW
jgi:hypothetical protein